MANFELFKVKIKRAEGGYQNLKTDDGNKNSKGEYVGTNFGISASFYEDIISRPPTVEDMKTITLALAYSLYEKYFWNGVMADKMKSQKLAETLVDHALNAGPKSAGLVIQRTLNHYFDKGLVVDGAIGNLTVAAINSVIDEEQLFIAFSQQRIADYKTKRTCSTFCPIWFDRVEDLADDFNIDLDEHIEPVKELASKKKSHNRIG